MRNYSILPQQNIDWQVVQKYCVDLDKKIIAIQDYIDFNNPNKIILNYKTDESDCKFYTNDQLIALGICDAVEDQINRVYLQALYPGQVIYNNFGGNIDLYDNDTDENLLESNIGQGMSILKLVGDNYQILALDSAGDFYVVSNVLSDGTLIFQLLPKATVNFGLNYWFAFCGQNARWIYRHPDAYTLYETSFMPTNWSGFEITSWFWDDTANNNAGARVNVITSKYDTLWPVSSAIGHEFFSKNTQRAYEEVVCDETFSISSKGLDKGSISIYTIITDLNNDVGDTDGANIRVCLY